MNSFEEPPLSERMTTAEHRADLAARLSKELLPAVHEKLTELGREYGRKWNVEEHLVSTWAAEVFREGADVLRDWEAGEAIASGHKLDDLALSLEVSGKNNVRRKAKHAARFTDSRRVSNDSEIDVPVTVGDWRVMVEPEGDNR